MPRQTSVKVTPDQADTLRRFALDLSARVGRRVSLGAAIVAAVTVAAAHPTEANAAAGPDSGDDE